MSNVLEEKAAGALRGADRAPLSAGRHRFQRGGLPPQRKSMFRRDGRNVFPRVPGSRTGEGNRPEKLTAIGGTLYMLYEKRRIAQASPARDIRDSPAKRTAVGRRKSRDMDGYAEGHQVLLIIDDSRFCELMRRITPLDVHSFAVSSVHGDGGDQTARRQNTAMSSCWTCCCRIFRGIECCGTCAHAKRAPVVILSAHNRETDASSVNSGADDYVPALRAGTLAHIRGCPAAHGKRRTSREGSDEAGTEVHALYARALEQQPCPPCFSAAEHQLVPPISVNHHQPPFIFTAAPKAAGSTLAAGAPLSPPAQP